MVNMHQVVGIYWGEGEGDRIIIFYFLADFGVFMD